MHILSGPESIMEGGKKECNNRMMERYITKKILSRRDILTPLTHYSWSYYKDLNKFGPINPSLKMEKEP